MENKILLDWKSLRAEEMASFISFPLMPNRGQSTCSPHTEGGGDGRFVQWGRMAFYSFL